MRLFTYSLAGLMSASGAMLAYAGFQCLDLTPGFPLGLGMIATGIFAATLVPLSFILARI